MGEAHEEAKRANRVTADLQPGSTGAPDAAELRALDRSLMRGLAWTGAVKWGTQVFSWTSMLVIARILTPADFGLVGMATIYLGFVQLINEFGLGAAIIRQRDLTDDQIAQLGGLSLAFGVFLWIVSIGLAFPVASFFDEAAVGWLIIVLGSGFVASGLRILPRSLLTRDLQFKKVSAVSGIEGLVAPAFTLLFAFVGLRYWSLVLGSLIGSFVATGLALRWRGHRLAWPRDIKRIAEPLRFGWHIVGSRVAWYLYSNADFAVVGRFFDKVALGGYTFAWTLASLPVTRIGDLVTQVTPAIFSAVQKDPAAVRRYLLKLTEGLALVTFPFSLGVSLVSDHFVMVALGPKWEGAVLPLRLLSFYAGFRSITLLFPQVLQAVGRSRTQMRLSILALLVLPPMFYGGARFFGVGGVAWAWIVGYPLVMLPAFRVVFEVTGIRAADYLATLWPAILGSGIMAASVLLVQEKVTYNLTDLSALALESATGAVVYGLFLLLMQRHRLRVFRNMLGELRR